ncbi:hypothetical protein UlMin_039674 [Ulmus minor]
MAKSSYLWMVLSIIIYLKMVFADPIVPALYVFGDSTADVGTNNNLSVQKRAKADFPFYGIDFPNSKPTGRFSNGLNTVDFIAQFLGYKRSPLPFVCLVKHKKRQQSYKRQLLKGANFASGGAGLQNNTGNFLGDVISFEVQIQQFALVRNISSDLLGDVEAKARISKSFLLISVGSNDIFEYFFYKTLPLQEFITTLVSSYETHLKNLLNLGAKKFAIVGIPPIGCCPFQRAALNQTAGGGAAATTASGCLDRMNVAAQMLNTELQSLLQKLSSQYVDMMYSFGNTFDMTMLVIGDPSGLEVERACCGKGKIYREGQCEEDSQVCNNRDDFLFWDQFHPTQAASNLSALALYTGGLKFVTPINFEQLAQAQLHA